MFKEENGLNTPSLSDNAALGKTAKQQVQQAAEQKIMKMSEEAIAQKGQKAAELIAKANQGVQATKQIAGISRALTDKDDDIASRYNVKNFASDTSSDVSVNNPTADPQQQALQLAKSLGIIPQITAEITIAGEPMNRYSYFTICQQSDQHHHFSITYDHSMDQPESKPLADVLDLTGELACFTIYPVNIPGAPQHMFSGIVTRAFKSFDHNPYGSLVVEGYSPTYLLDDKRTKSINSWYKKEIAAIIMELTEPLQEYQTNIIAAPKNIKKTDYICQYKETPFQFMRRMAYDFGEYVFYDGINLCYGQPRTGLAIEMLYGTDCENLQISFELKAVNHSHLVYHSATDKKEIKNAPGSIDGLEYLAKRAYEKSRQTFTAPSVMPVPFRVSPNPELLDVAVKSHAASEAASMYKVSGTSRRHDLKVGAIIDLYTPRVEGGLQVGSESIGKFFVTSVLHKMESCDKYHNEFEAVPEGLPMLPMENVEYPLAEAQPAVVTSNKDPEGQGRVRVKFFWSQSDAGISDWIKVLTPDAGGSEKVSKNKGFVSIPEEGDLVMVDFRYGQPDQPFVTGSIHPGTKAGGGGEGNNLKSFSSKSGHSLTMNDGAGITLRDRSRLNHISVDGKNTITITAAHNITLTNGKSTISLIDGKVSIIADESIDIQAPSITIGSIGGEKPTVSMKSQAQTMITEAEIEMTDKAPKMNIGDAGQTNLLSIACAGLIDIGAKAMVKIAGGEVQINKS